MPSSRAVLVVLVLSMISMQGIHARGLGVELEPEKVGKALKKLEDKVLPTIKQLVSSVAMTLVQKRQEHEDGPSSAGKGSITSSDQATKWKAMRRQAMSVKHGGSGTEAEGAFDSSDENGAVVEDVVVMDYAQPHRKPPIHNEKS